MKNEMLPELRFYLSVKFMRKLRFCAGAVEAHL